MTTPTQPLIAVDVVPLTFDPAAGLHVGTAVRKAAPYQGVEALPGVLLGTGEHLAAAAERALNVKAGITDIRHLTQVGAFDQAGRDPRDHAISIAFLAVTGKEAGAIWRPVGERLTGLPFDHTTIVGAALAQARTRLWVDADLTRALLGEKFTTSAAARLTADLTGTKPHPGNFHRSLTGNPALTRIGEAAFTGPGRPPALWAWVD